VIGLMNFETNKLLAESHLGLATSEDYVRWAVTCLESDVDSKNIRILASLQKPLYSSEVDDYFKRCMRDLGWTMPEPGECLRQYARELARQILANDLAPLDGCSRIFKVAAALDYPRELTMWIYLYEGLDPSTYDELQEADWDEAIKNEAILLALS
jgi:hypothetical protein